MFISIVTVCYNSSKTIERTINSILNQSFKDYEYLIVDGGSTDGTLDIIQAYEPKFDGRMKWISEKDKGIYDAFTKGCKWASGLYVWIVNSDDWIETNALKDINDFAQNIDDQNSVLVGRMKIISENGVTKSVSDRVTQKTIRIAYKKDTMGIPHPASIISKSAYEKIGYYDERFRISGDIDWFNRAYKADIKFCCFDSILINFLEGGASTGGVSNAIAAKDRYLSFQRKYHNKYVAKLHLWWWWIKIVIHKIIG